MAGYVWGVSYDQLEELYAREAGGNSEIGWAWVWTGNAWKPFFPDEGYPKFWGDVLSAGELLSVFKTFPKDLYGGATLREDFAKHWTTREVPPRGISDGLMAGEWLTVTKIAVKSIYEGAVLEEPLHVFNVDKRPRNQHKATSDALTASGTLTVTKTAIKDIAEGATLGETYNHHAT